jgi:hypothetical protein
VARRLPGSERWATLTSCSSSAARIRKSAANADGKCEGRKAYGESKRPSEPKRHSSHIQAPWPLYLCLIFYWAPDFIEST